MKPHADPFDVMILCQGQQRRLPGLRQPKQLLQLPACRLRYACDTVEPVSILSRTLLQLALLLPRDVDDDGSVHTGHVTVIGAGDRFSLPVEGARQDAWHNLKVVLHANSYELARPGNSSLKGIAQYTKDQGGPTSRSPNSRYVVLLGDVVYSWRALRSCLNLNVTGSTNRRRDEVEWGFTFAGSSDLSPSGGELWGLQWGYQSYASMMMGLYMALEKHPKFEEYQPGQMRRWLWAMADLQEMRRDPLVAATRAFQSLGPTHAIRQPWYITVPSSDYTRDIDLPEHVAMLGELSEKAKADDAQNGLVWAT